MILCNDVIFRHHLLNDFCSGFYAIQPRANLSDFQFTFFKIPFKHASLLSAPAQKRLQFFQISTPLIGIHHRLIKRILQQPHRCDFL